MSKTLGFIGCGNMGRAMMGGIIKDKVFSPENMIVSDLNEESLKMVSEQYGIQITTDNNEVAKTADILILSIKPNLYPVVIKGIKDSIKEDVVVVSIAAGVSIKDVEEMFEKKIKIVRVMPNTPALVGEGMSALCPNPMVNKGEFEEVLSIFKGFGKVEVIDEKLIDAVIAVSGSSPAYIYMIIEAMADGAVLEGMPRDQAYRMAAQAVLGSAKMVLETGMHPGALKDMVCSPGGTTIEAVAALEERGLRDSIISAMRTCAEKSRDMAKEK